MDVSTDPKLRKKIKEYSKMQSFPQLFYKCKLLGGLQFIKDQLTSHNLFQFVHIHPFYFILFDFWGFRLPFKMLVHLCSKKCKGLWEAIEFACF